MASSKSKKDAIPRSKSGTAISLATVVLIGAGCAPEKRTMTTYGPAVWSEDAASIAFAKTTFVQESSKGFATIGGREYDFRNQIFVTDRKDSNRVPIGSLRPGNLLDLYYMKNAGYLLASYRESEASNGMVTWVRWPLSEAGSFREHADTGRFQLLPSRDGALLAKVRYYTDCDGVSDPERDCLVRVEFLSASDFSAAFPPDTLIFHPDPLWIGPLVRWTSGDRLQIAHRSDRGGYHLSPGQTPEAFEEESCWHPRTSSDVLSPAGEVVGFDRSGAISILPGPSIDTSGC